MSLSPLPRRRHPAAAPARLAFVASCLFLVACGSADNKAAFTAAAARPVPLNTAHARDALAGEPLRALTPPAPPATAADAAMIALGNRLYHDVRLSGDDTISCASCHDLAQGGDDGARTSTGINGAVGPINAPTVLNAVFNFRQFWDGRAADLGEQAQGPVTNPLEMGAAWPDVIDKLAREASYREAFAGAFGDGAITVERIARAIARFEETLVTPSPFDRYLLGDASAIDDEARHGYELFKSYGCVACHQGMNVGGNLYQKFGALQSAFDIASDADKGRQNVTNNQGDEGVFKVPSLRNVELTSPYFHVGSVARLEDAIRIMGTTQLGTTIPDRDIALIAAFLRSLTGEPAQLAAATLTDTAATAAGDPQ
ncbi:MAG: cytochrome c peroxidase [Gammaproteobacteria bacterium]